MTNIKLNDMAESKGIVINPSQFIYIVEHGTPARHGEAVSGTIP